MATGIPFFITFPIAKESINRFKTNSIRFNKSWNWVLSANSTSSSAKSNSSSISEAKFSNSSLNLAISLEKPPRICCKATSWEALLSEAIKSATASAWLKSKLPFKNARKVNSPGLAALAPFLISKLKICWII